MEKLVTLKQTKSGQKNTYQIVYPNGILKSMDRVIGISGTTTDRIEYQLKEPNEDEFASLNIQHLNQNGTNELIGESKYPTHDVDSRNQMINEKIREYID